MMKTVPARKSLLVASLRERNKREQAKPKQEKRESSGALRKQLFEFIVRNESQRRFATLALLAQ